MTIIQIEALKSGLHPMERQSHRRVVWLDGYIEVPPHLESAVWAAGGWCDLTIEDGNLVGVTPTERPPEPGPTAAEQITALKAELASTDYKAIKYAEGWLTEEEYGPVRAQRQELRDRINRLEAQDEQIHQDHPFE